MDSALGYALLRLTLGLNFLFHSFQRWHDLGRFVDGVAHDFTNTPLPVWSVRAFAALIPFWEPVVGVLLILGLWTRVGLVSGSLLMVALTFGTALRGDYAALNVQLLYALVFFVLLLCRAQHDRFSLDILRGKARSRRLDL